MDEGALWSIVNEAPQPPDFDLGGVGYMNLVDASWRPHDDDSEDLDSNDQPFEPIEGCRAENVGWIKKASQMVGLSGYDAFTNLGDWYAFYKRLPGVVAYWVYDRLDKAWHTWAVDAGLAAFKDLCRLDSPLFVMRST